MVIVEKIGNEDRFLETFNRISGDSHGLITALAKEGLAGRGLTKAVIAGIVDLPKVMAYHPEKGERFEKLIAIWEFPNKNAVVVVCKTSWESEGYSCGRGYKNMTHLFFDNDRYRAILTAASRDIFALPLIDEDGNIAYAQRHEVGSLEFYVNDEYIKSIGALDCGSSETAGREYGSSRFKTKLAEEFGKSNKGNPPEGCEMWNWELYCRYLEFLINQDNIILPGTILDGNKRRSVRGTTNSGRIAIKNNTLFWIRDTKKG